MSNDGYKVTALSKLFAVRTRTVYAWFKQWHKNGITGLNITLGRGRKATLNSDSEELECKIKEALSHNRQRLDLVCEEISNHLSCKVSKDMMKRYLKKKDLFGND